MVPSGGKLCFLIREFTYFTWFFCYIFNFNIPTFSGASLKPVNLLFLHELFDIFSISMYLRSLELLSSLWICFFYMNYLIYLQFQCTRVLWSFFRFVWSLIFLCWKVKNTRIWIINPFSGYFAEHLLPSNHNIST